MQKYHVGKQRRFTKLNVDIPCLQALSLVLFFKAGDAVEGEPPLLQKVYFQAMQSKAG